ncbi:hypothetical protein J437_LFUL014070 [Ladona fulva]|uniref:Uncharacterized protein n=1 Tax=Ladona fulva TaxID=123851 RepID=A0A8K0KM52_LADFU|nr:hypothetical protein J437_LFUL014070 [Ladona fulva]
MFEKPSNVYKRDMEEIKNQLIAEFIKYEYNKSVDVMTNIAALQTLAFRRNSLKLTVDDTVLMTKILMILPDQFKHFGSAWDSTAEDKKTQENLRARLLKEEEKLKKKLSKSRRKSYIQSIQVQNLSPYVSITLNDICCSTFLRAQLTSDCMPVNSSLDCAHLNVVHTHNMLIVAVARHP